MAETILLALAVPGVAVMAIFIFTALVVAAIGGLFLSALE